MDYTGLCDAFAVVIVKHTAVVAVNRDGARTADLHAMWARVPKSRGGKGTEGTVRIGINGTAGGNGTGPLWPICTATLPCLRWHDRVDHRHPMQRSAPDEIHAARLHQQCKQHNPAQRTANSVQPVT